MIDGIKRDPAKWVADSLSESTQVVLRPRQTRVDWLLSVIRGNDEVLSEVARGVEQLLLKAARDGAGRHDDYWANVFEFISRAHLIATVPILQSLVATRRFVAETSEHQDLHGRIIETLRDLQAVDPVETWRREMALRDYAPLAFGIIRDLRPASIPDVITDVVRLGFATDALLTVVTEAHSDAVSLIRMCAARIARCGDDVLIRAFKDAVMRLRVDSAAEFQILSELEPKYRYLGSVLIMMTNSTLAVLVAAQLKQFAIESLVLGPVSGSLSYRPALILLDREIFASLPAEWSQNKPARPAICVTFTEGDTTPSDLAQTSQRLVTLPRWSDDNTRARLLVDVVLELLAQINDVGPKWSGNVRLQAATSPAADATALAALDMVG